MKLKCKKFIEILTSSVKDQAVRKVAQELNVETDTYGACRREKVGISAVGELTRSNLFAVSLLPEGL